MSCMTTPMAARTLEAAGSLAFWMDSQHWTGPVVQEFPADPSPGVGVATARIAREAMVKSLANMANIDEDDSRELGNDWWVF